MKCVRVIVFNLDGLGSRPCPMLLAGIASLVTSSIFSTLYKKIQRSTTVVINTKPYLFSFVQDMVANNPRAESFTRIIMVFLFDLALRDYPISI